VIEFPVDSCLGEEIITLVEPEVSERGIQKYMTNYEPQTENLRFLFLIGRNLKTSKNASNVQLVYT
jgi:hypothetical protein